jgi:glycosyltransferase involved in cell wall biosynthesis
MATRGNPEHPAVGSGVPASLLQALREVVGTVIAIDDAPTGARRRATLAVGALTGMKPSHLVPPAGAKAQLGVVGEASHPFASFRERTVHRHLAGLAVDGIVQLGADYDAPAGLPMVTRQDSTVRQAVEAYPWRHLRGLTQRHIEGLERRQRAAYESAAACCAATHWAADSIVRDYGVPASKVHVIGVAAQHPVAEAELRERDWRVPRFLYVGVDWERKNGRRILTAFGRVRDAVPYATLDVVGAHPRLDSPGVTGHGRLASDDPAGRAQLAKLYSRATAFVMPSLHEPAGAVYIEAAAAGIPSIGTTNGGARTCVGETGYLVDPLAVDQLVDAMLRLCDPELARSLGARARERAKLFTWRNTAERLVRAFELPDVDLSGLAEFL